MKTNNNQKAIRDAKARMARDHAEAYHQRQEANPERKESKFGSFTFYMFVACLLTWAAYSYGVTIGGM